jgi:protein tyrosine phosphatase (PTP) superfamily phosphohydrolase (DUF442 family)
LDISQITGEIYIAAHPKARQVNEIIDREISLIICMIFHPPALVYWRDPFRMLWLPTFDAPFLRIPIRKLSRGVSAALGALAEGESVLVYCRQGRHRSVAMACCILIGLGYSVDEAVALVKEKRSAADPDVWYIRERIELFANE